MYQLLLILIHPKCIIDTDNDTFEKSIMIHVSLILATLHDT